METTSVTKHPLRRVVTDTALLPENMEISESKRTILAAALELFASKGFAATSIRDIAKVANMKSASLYSHYKSKEQILATLINIGHEELLRCMRRAVIGSNSHPVQQLRALIKAHVRLHAEFSMLAVVINHELHALGKEYISGALALRSQGTELLLEIIRRGQTEGVFHLVHDPLLAGSAIGAMGIRVAEWYTDNHPLSIEEVEEAYADFGCQIVGAQTTP